MAVTHVPGKKAGSVFLYALSTCGWCKMTKKLFNDMGIEYDYVDVDELAGKERETTVEEVKKHNPNLNFPTMVINGKTIIGYKEGDIKEALKK